MDMQEKLLQHESSPLIGSLSETSTSSLFFSSGQKEPSHNASNITTTQNLHRHFGIIQEIPIDENEDDTNLSDSGSFLTSLSSLYSSQSFLWNILSAILLAYVYPPIGAIYAKPDITAGWITVIFIFLISGLGLQTDDLQKSFHRLHFNLFVHFFNFGIISAIVYCVSHLLIHMKVIHSNLGEGWIICSCLPLTINVVVVLTKSAGGDEAAAVFNAALGSFLGVFISPALIFFYVGVKGSIDLARLFHKLICIVLVPILVGQVLLQHSHVVATFVTKYKAKFKSAQEYALVFTVYTVFCKTFIKGSISSAREVFMMILLEFFLICFVMTLAWVSLGWIFVSVSPDLRVMGLFGCTLKSISVGIPLINAIYGTSPFIGLYTLPLLIWHPMQLIISVGITPSLARYIQRKREQTHDNTEALIEA